MRAFLFSLSLSLANLPVSVTAAPSLEGPSVRDVVEFTKILQPDDQNDDALQDQVSPDGSHAFIVIRKADIDSDTNRYRIQLLDVRPDHLAAQTTPRCVGGEPTITGLPRYSG